MILSPSEVFWSFSFNSYASLIHLFTLQVQYEFLVRCLLHRARGITDADDITESDENSEVLDDTSHIYGNV